LIPKQIKNEIFEINQKLKNLLAPRRRQRIREIQRHAAIARRIYENDYYGRCEIVQDGDALKMEWGPAKYPATLKHWNNGAFLMQFPGATQTPSVTTFMIGEDGRLRVLQTESWGS
jgi:hypothetical protein